MTARKEEGYRCVICGKGLMVTRKYLDTCSEVCHEALRLKLLEEEVLPPVK